MENRALTCVHTFGGKVELIFQDMHLVISEGASPHYLSAEESNPQKHQLLVRFDDGTGFYCTVRMYGCMALYPNGETDNIYYLLARDKPSPLSQQFDAGYFQTIIDAADAKVSAKALLATEQRIPGLGNGVLQDILFDAGIHPQAKLINLTEEDRDRLFSSVKNVLAKMTTLGGRNTEKDLYDTPGGYKTILSHKTKDDPCPLCGNHIVKKNYLGGAVYFCSTCQTL